MRNLLEVERPAHYLRRLASTEFGQAYKSLVADELRINPGATVLDLGCGPGVDLRAFAEAVGPAGRVLGLDSDAGAVSEAVRDFADCDEVEVRVGDVHALDLTDRSVDRVHTDRVLQHVVSPTQVVAEATRVLRPGGMGAFAEPDWDTLVIDFPEPAVPVAYRRFITERVVRNPRMGRALPGLCESAGLDVARVVPVTGVFRDVVAADQVFGFQRVTSRAVAAGYLTASAGSAWLDHLRTRPFFASVSVFVTTAIRPGD